MRNIDKDLLALQEVRDLVIQAKKAQKVVEDFSQEQVDRIVEAMAMEAIKASDWLAKLAAEETGVGVYEHKIIKNLFAARAVYDHIKDMKTVGVINIDKEKGIYEIAEPVGVIAALTPVTNPTSTVIYKSLIAVKARNAVVFSPHPRAIECTGKAVEILHKAAVRAGAPEGILGCLSTVTLEAAQALMKHPDVSLILATGGAEMVKAAYSAGKPAYGVGPGNVPAYIEASADVPTAVKCIIDSKTFDNGTICSAEQAIICEHSNASEVKSWIEKLGGVFLRPDEAYRLEKYMFRSDGTLNPAVVGKSACYIAEAAGIPVPKNTRVLVVPLDGAGKEYPLSKEKLSPVIAFYEVGNWQEACKLCVKILEAGGMGHTLCIHSRNEEIIMKFALEKPAFRILVNQPGVFGAIGGTSGLPPSLTLGCGTLGGNITSDNIGPQHLMNIKRLAYPVRTVEELETYLKGGISISEKRLDPELVRRIVEEVIKRLS
ncbi:MAG: acetaldehyde dehydrogenase (acetylating) [Synergistetes bacterium]|nr:acetaldehyde dehydrogenase (acetylating) [Synergistota bacterium]MCX8127751.1 acetaldehyde dehydrogenase (acetylating) [Synergistota bacterium]MDW8191333.1 acetaldehyde dehydrogenase (acetylating) [Synergistota bacterium]